MSDQPPTDHPAITEPSLGELGQALFGEDTGPVTQPREVWRPPAPEELQRLLPHYQILEMIGRGGMGAVYLASQSTLDRLVAIKILWVELDSLDSGFNERFKNEARAMAKLSHPGIISIHDFGQTNTGLHYIVMEFIEGINVQQMIAASRRLHTEHALAITAHVCDALHYAHERGIVHRDIKPANIIVGYDGRVKVADFGLAKVGAAAEALELTQIGTAIGTPHYIAPESLIPGEQTDRRADIYATGVMLYQMLTGKLPQGLFELPSIQVPGLDPRLDDIIAHALREDRELRYPTAAAMRAALDGILTHPVAVNGPEAALPPEARPQRPGYQRPTVIQPTISGAQGRKYPFLIGLSLLALLGAVIWYLSVGSTPFSDQQKVEPLLTLATREAPFSNTLGMQFVPVPGTDTLFCTHETRWRDFAAYTKENPSATESWTSEARERLVAEGLRNHPVSHVNSHDARAFCAWLSRRENRLYRLPTDREWSLAAGIGEAENWEPFTTPTTVSRVEDVYPWGSKWPPPTGAGNYSDASRAATAPPNMKGAVTGGYEDGFPGTAPVMSFPPNKLGLFDMGGNIWELMNDWLNHAKDMYVMRGNSYTSYAQVALQTSTRGTVGPELRMSDIGFRIVLAESVPTPPVPPPLTTPTNPQSTPSLVTNSLGMVFVPVPGTEVLFSIYESRWKDYAVFAAETPTLDPSWKDQTFNGIHVNGPAQDHPVVKVNWLEAVQFCQWLTRKEHATGLLKPQESYRLPTDAEWSHAVGIGSQEVPSLFPAEKSNKVEAYPWGRRFPPGPGDGNYADRSAMLAASSGTNRLKYLQHFDDGHPTTAPVGSFNPNAHGIFDLAGNVGEWCQDWYDQNHKTRVIRGGSWTDGNTSTNTLSSFRSRNQPDFRNPYIGFRIVRERTPTASPAPPATAPAP